MTGIGFEFLYLDVAGTLLVKPGVVPAIAAVLGHAGVDLPHQAIAVAHRRLAERLVAPDRTTRPFYERFNAALLDDLGVEPAPELVATIYEACRGLPWEPAPGIDALGDLDVPLGVISNWDDTLRTTLAALVPLEFVEVVVSAEVGVRKPDPAIYLEALRRIGAPAGRVAYVGDSPHLDLTPARELGLRALIVDDVDAFGLDPLSAVRSLVEVPDALAGVKPR